MPQDLAGLPASAALAQALESVDRSRLSGFDRVELVRARARLKAHLEAELLADLVSVLDAEAEVLGDELPRDELFDLAAAELGAALTWTRRASQRQLGFALSLVSDHPGVWEMLHAGVIDYPKALLLVEQTAHLDPVVRDQVMEAVLPQAPRLSTGLLRARIRKLSIWVDPDSAKEQYEEGWHERRVVAQANPDGTANLMGLSLSPRDTQAALRRIDRLAKKTKTRDDARSIDQIRADILIDLLCGGVESPGSDRGVVDIRVELTTLLELDDKPGELLGWGPVISDIARQAVDQQIPSEWRWTVTNHEGEEIVASGVTRRRPTTSQRRRVQSQAPACVFPPGCPIPSIQCDLDHNTPWAQHGPTQDDNLGPLCRHHHRIRHRGWTIQQVMPGIYQLTSPLGQTYTTRPRAP